MLRTALCSALAFAALTATAQASSGLTVVQSAVAEGHTTAAGVPTIVSLADQTALVGESTAYFGIFRTVGPCSAPTLTALHAPSTPPPLTVDPLLRSASETVTNLTGDVACAGGGTGTSTVALPGATAAVTWTAAGNPQLITGQPGPIGGPKCLPVSVLGGLQAQASVHVVVSGLPADLGGGLTADLPASAQNTISTITALAAYPC